MLSYEYLPAIITGLSVSFLHASIPTHWLPFVLAARSQKWSYKKALSILLIAASGHIITTSVLGALLVWFGVQVHQNLEKVLILVGAASILLFGFWQIYQFYFGNKHSHCDHGHSPHTHDYSKTSQDGWAILSLLTLLTFSPCEAFLPVYVSAWPLGWNGFLVLSLVLAFGTLFAMTLFMTALFKSSEKIKFTWLENNEKLINGILLILLALFMMIFEVFIGHNH